MNSNEHVDYEHVLDEAALWVSRMQGSTVTAEQENAFKDWLNKSEAHQKAYGEMLATWSQIGLAAEIPEFRAEAEYLSKRRPVKKRLSKKLIFSVAASIFVVFSLSMQLFRQQYLDTRDSNLVSYTTGIGELREISLSDGSSILLNTKSRVDVSYKNDVRSLRLVHGEAHFEVAHDPSRPFIVSIGDSSVRAVGTAFNIYRQPRKTVVTITEGIVSIKSKEDSPEIEVDALHRVSIDRHTVQSVHNADLNVDLAWQDQQLVFRESSLTQVVRELNRYLANPISIARSTLPKRTVSGTFDITEPEKVLKALIDNFSLSEELAGGTRILRQAS